MRVLVGKALSFARMVAEGKGKQAVLGAYVEILTAVFDLLPHDGVDIPSREWDVLVVLDACRYDYYERLTPLDGSLKKRISRGSSTSEWLHANFTGYYKDIVYVSANPRISDVEVDGFRGEDHFYTMVNVWRFDWDPELNTVVPEAVTDAAVQARHDYPDKRLIVHYIQPHAPWIGETKLSDREMTIDDPTPDDWIGTGKTWGTMLNEGKSMDVVKQAYEDNLTRVLGEVERLVEYVGGDIVVTSDHGECFGEKFIVEHPSGIYIDELVGVPWHTVDADLASSSDFSPATESSEQAKINRSVDELPLERL